MTEKRVIVEIIYETRFYEKVDTTAEETIPTLLDNLGNMCGIRSINLIDPALDLPGLVHAVLAEEARQRYLEALTHSTGPSEP